MPKINRIRLVNFKYGDQEKMFHNQDCKIDAGCGNTLIELMNGGGKTTMFNSIIQALRPNSTLDGKRGEVTVKSQFFTHNTAPVTSLMEIALDNDNGYITIGTFLHLKERDGRSDVDYFNVIVESERTNRNSPLDIYSDEVVKTKNGELENWARMRDKLRKFGAQDNTVNVRIFETEREYDAALAEYGIPIDEVNITTKYTKEGGLKEYVKSKNNTSEKLIFDWALSVITSVYESYDPACKENIDNIIHFIKDNEFGLKFVEELPTYEKLLAVTKEAIGMTEDIQGPIEDVIEAGDMLCNYHSGLISTEEITIEKQEQLTDDKSAIINAIEETKWKDSSRTYYEHCDSQKEQEKVYLKAAEETEQMRQKKQDALIALMAQKCAQLDERKKDLQQQMQTLIDTRDKDSDDNLRQLGIISSTLREMCDQEVEDMEHQLTQTLCQVETLEAEKKELKETLAEEREHHEQIHGDVKLMEEKRREHLAYSKDVIEKHHLRLPARDMLGTPFATDAMETEEEQLEKAKEAAHEEARSAVEKLKKINETKEQTENEYYEKKSSIQINSRFLADTSKELDKLTAEENRCALSLQEFHMEPEDEEQDVRTAVAEKVFALEEKIRSGRLQQKEASAFLARLRTGTFLANTEFGEWLEEQGYPYKTGEQRLREIGAVERRKILKSAPYFPSAYIVAKDVYENIQERKDELCEKNLGMIPILTSQDGGSQTGDIFAFYNKDVVDPTKRKETEQRYVKRIEELDHRNRVNEEALEDLRLHAANVERYYQIQGMKAQIEEKISSIEETIKALEEEMNILSESVALLTKKKEQAEDELEASRDKEAECINAHEAIGELIEKERQYAQMIEELAQTKKEEEKSEKTIYRCDAALAETEDNLEASRRLAYDQDVTLQKKRDEAEEYSITTDDRLEEEYEMLRARFVALREAIERSDNIIQVKIDTCQEKIDSLDEQMRDSRFDVVDKESLPAFDTTLMHRHQEVLEQAEKDLATCEERLTEEKGLYDKLKAKAEAYMDNVLRGKEPVDRDEIDFSCDYKEEIRRLNNESEEIQGAIQECEEYLVKVRGMIADIKRAIPEEELAASDGHAEPIEPSEAYDTEKAIRQYIKQMDEEKKHVDSLLDKLYKLVSREQKEDYLTLQGMNVGSAFTEVNLMLISRDYEKLLEGVEAQRNYLDTNRQSIELHIETEKKNNEVFLQQFDEYAKMVYNNLKFEIEALGKLSNLSTYPIGGEKKKTIKITQPKDSKLIGTTPEMDEKNIEVLREYIKSLAKSVSGEPETEWREQLEKKMSNKTIFSLFMENRDWKVELLQVSNVKSTYTRPMGDRARGYFSGAQFTMASFFLIITEMYFRRDQSDKGIEGGFIFLDNPFAEMTYKVGVQGLIDTARKGGIQIIASTAVQESQVLEAFDTVVACRLEGYGKNYVIKSTHMKINNVEHTPYVEEGEQIAI